MIRRGVCLTFLMVLRTATSQLLLAPSVPASPSPSPSPSSLPPSDLPDPCVTTPLTLAGRQGGAGNPQSNSVSPYQVQGTPHVDPADGTLKVMVTIGGSAMFRGFSLQSRFSGSNGPAGGNWSVTADGWKLVQCPGGGSVLTSVDRRPLQQVSAVWTPPLGRVGFRCSFFANVFQGPGIFWYGIQSNPVTIQGNPQPLSSLSPGNVNPTNVGEQGGANRTSMTDPALPPTPAAASTPAEPAAQNDEGKEGKQPQKEEKRNREESDASSASGRSHPAFLILLLPRLFSHWTM